MAKLTKAEHLAEVEREMKNANWCYEHDQDERMAALARAQIHATLAATADDTKER